MLQNAYFLAKIGADTAENEQQNVARFRLYGHRFLQENTFCNIFQNLPDYAVDFFEIWQTFAKFLTFTQFLLNFHENCRFSKPIILLKI